MIDKIDANIFYVNLRSFRIAGDEIIYIANIFYGFFCSLLVPAPNFF